MLPDFPKLTDLCREIITARMETVGAHRLDILQKARRSVVFEGNRNRLVKEDGSVSESGFRTAEAEFSLTHAEAEALTLDKLMEIIDRAATRIAEQKMQHFFQTIDQGIEEVGNVVHHGEEGVTPEHFFRSLDMIHMDFDENGAPTLPTIVGGGDFLPKIKEVLRRIEADPALLSQYAEIINRQRERWRARESNRKLVG